ncbi:5-formyltetrahydrofolate cyclo-ligase [Psychromarinibacter sp. C21-152]|uniref:5-formyltetrahydrofolate cyclo-ligase n=1 Tax=Psychromarinibacter sediminicola TaxID=3033385 RepID=A0AAE3NSR9_9RHOB|nr:5-formyltetrahydrofolate cyclo-ligase [Psychromarinibacter sediminicola]MDF0599882.1 5-formyltetrahydrofolate cyclo-ligase [Psychromarinibacter sediminicola]
MTGADELAAAKAATRKAAFARRQEAYDTGDRAAGAARLQEVLQDHRGAPLAGYMPMRTEIDPLPAMAAHATDAPVGVPVMQGKGRPLVFHLWQPEAEMQEGPFGARIPVSAAEMTPAVLIVPLVAFDRAGNRLGYGGGFYDRTLERLRAAAPTRAIGFAWAAQEAEALPLEPTDQPLDAIVTERETLLFG